MSENPGKTTPITAPTTSRELPKSTLTLDDGSALSPFQLWLLALMRDGATLAQHDDWYVVRSADGSSEEPLPRRVGVTFLHTKGLVQYDAGVSTITQAGVDFVERSAQRAAIAEDAR